MLSLFENYCKNQQLNRNILKQSLTSFSSTKNTIQNHIKKLIDQRERYLRREDLFSFYPEFDHPSEEDLDSFLTKFKVHQRVPYEMFRKDLIQLAYKTYSIRKDQSLKYIESVIIGDYQNNYKEKMTRQVFLAELYGIQFRVNYHGKALNFALKSLTHWQNVVENHCSFYKKWKKDKSFDVDAFTKNMEIVYYDQYLECLVAVQRLFYQHGDFENSKAFFEKAQTKIDEATQIISYCETDLNEITGLQKDNYNQFLEHHKNQFLKFLVDSKFTQIKISIWERNIELGEELLKEIIQRQIANEQQQQLLLILRHELMQFSKNNYSEEILLMTQQVIVWDLYENNYQQGLLCFDQEMIWYIDDKYAFLFKHEYDCDNEQKKSYKQTLDENAGSFTEILRHYLEVNTLQNSFQHLFGLSLTAAEYLRKNNYNKHYFWDLIIFSLLLATYRIERKNLQYNLNQVQKMIVDRPLEKIFEFFQLIIEFEKTSQINKINQTILLQIKQIKFEQYFINYQKQLVIEQISNNYNLFKELDECYQNQITLLRQYESFHKEALEELLKKQKQNEL